MAEYKGNARTVRAENKHFAVGAGQASAAATGAWLALGEGYLFPVGELRNVRSSRADHRAGGPSSASSCITSVERFSASVQDLPRKAVDVRPRNLEPKSLRTLLHIVNILKSGAHR